ncbi:MAG: WhiB family transcriptional regulator [Microthrixaceae bacterium]|nr:WhiB family transcriptional regulator [Microthrixaceae bacterium]MCO5318203.1 WhiB family transcriptional regulator [Microthrixaceae bacterium]
MTATVTFEKPRPELLDGPRGWEHRAACADLPTADFFTDDVDEISAAKRVCLRCEVRGECLDAAVARREQFGIWGGHLFVAGRIVLSKRRRGRPPKVPRPNDSFPEVDVPAPYRRLVATEVA